MNNPKYKKGDYVICNDVLGQVSDRKVRNSKFIYYFGICRPGEKGSTDKKWITERKLKYATKEEQAALFLMT